MDMQDQASRAAFVVGAVKAGYTYSEVARALGISRQRAHQLAQAADGLWQSPPDSANIKSEMEKLSPMVTKENDHPPLPTEPMSPTEVAQTYGMSERAVYKWVSKGLIRVIQRGGGRGNLTILDAEDLRRALALYFDNPGQGKDPLKPLKEARPVSA